MFWRNGYQNNTRNAYNNNRTPAPAWSTSQNGQPVQRLQNMLRQAQQTHANQQQLQLSQQQNQPHQQPLNQQSQLLNQRSTPLAQQPKQHQYHDPSVSFEPLSEDLLKLMGQQKEASTIAAPIESVEEKTPEKPSNQEIPQSLFTNPYLPKSLNADVISSLMQDEQNGAIFYHYLSNRLPNGKEKETILRIASENEKRIMTLNEMHKDIAFGKDFVPQKNNIELNADLRTCLRAAAAEESSIIEKIIGLLETEKNAKLETMLYRKLNNVNLLLSL